MDKRRSNKLDWSWLPGFMPQVAQLIAAQKATHGEEHVRACWHRGVVQMLPGHFWAAEGALTIGVPTAAQVLDWYEPAPGIEPPTAMLHIAQPAGGTDGSA